jgi:hypothetical protein
MPDVTEAAAGTTSAERAATLERLATWDFCGIGLHPGGSNYVFVGQLQPPSTKPGDDDADQLFVIYKPSAGERPLRDFPYGTLHLREQAAYLLSEELGWPLAPPLVVREGPHGEGSVQLFIEHDQSANYFTMRADCLDKFAPVAMFDVLVHNADRKGGSCLKDGRERIWAIDHGLTFNEYARRRTVMFEFNGDPYPQDLLARLAEVRREIEPGRALGKRLGGLIGDDEVRDLADRADSMIESGVFPVLDPQINVPYPFI